MRIRLRGLLDRIRASRGPFFLARLQMKLSLPQADAEECIRELLAAGRELGSDPLPEEEPPR
jgi:hypothetical protein